MCQEPWVQVSRMPWRCCAGRAMARAFRSSPHPLAPRPLPRRVWKQGSSRGRAAAEDRSQTPRRTANPRASSKGAPVQRALPASQSPNVDAQVLYIYVHKLLLCTSPLLLYSVIVNKANVTWLNSGLILRLLKKHA